MAQTVAVQKGTVACTWSSSPAAQTIFTQSSGVATRVIVNSLELSAAGSNSFYIQFFILNGTTGIYSHLTTLKGFGTPNLGITVQQGPPTSQPVSTTPATNSYIYYNTSSPAATLYNAAVTNTTSYISASSDQMFYFPGNFWMTNGDSLIVRGQWGNVSGNCYYNFTTITET